jgi:hypothetical protein
MYKKYTWNDCWLLTPTTYKVVSPVQEVGENLVVEHFDSALEHSQPSCKYSIFVKIDDTVAKKHQKTLPADPLF